MISYYNTYEIYRYRPQPFLLEADHAVATATEAIKVTDTLSTKVNQLSLEKAQLEKQMGEMNEKLLRQESYNRRENLKFEMVPESNDENCENIVREIITGKLGLNDAEMKIVRCHRLGKKKMGLNPTPRPIIVRFLWFKDREEVWNSRRNLKESPIRMREDFAPEIEARRRKLYPVLRVTIRDPNIEYAALVYDKLKIDGKMYSTKELSLLPPSLQLNNLGTNSNDKTLVFWGRNPPLSNHYLSDFNISGTRYNCFEQYLMHKKCQFVNDDVRAHRVMLESDPGQQKRIGGEIIMPPAWTNVLPDVIKTGLLAKFNQSESARQYLMDTKDKLLAEAYDIRWGNGLSLYHQDALNPTKWKGRNILGEALMEVRSQMK